MWEVWEACDGVGEVDRRLSVCNIPSSAHTPANLPSPFRRIHLPPFLPLTGKPPPLAHLPPLLLTGHPAPADLFPCPLPPPLPVTGKPPPGSGSNRLLSALSGKKDKKVPELDQVWLASVPRVSC